jgi:hypothetical protein
MKLPKSDAKSREGEKKPKPLFLFVMLGAVALALLTASGALHAQAPQLDGKVGSLQAEAATTVVLGNLPQKSAADRAIPGRFSSLLHPQVGVSDKEFAARKLQAASLRSATQVASGSGGAPTVASGEGVFTPGTIRNFDGVNETCSFVTPGDASIAVSQFFGMQVENDCITVFNKTTGVPYAGYPVSTNTFFGLPANNFNTGQFMSDPRLVFDWVQRRFVFAMLWEDLPNSRGFVMLAASANDDPRGTWYKYGIQIGGTGQCPDYPQMGQNYGPDPGNGAVALGFNLFGCNPNGFTNYQDDQIHFFPKAALYSGAGFGWNFFFGPTIGGVLVDTLQPADVQSRSDKPRAIFGVNSYNINFGGGSCSSGCNGLIVWSFSNVLQRTGSPGLQWGGVAISTPSNYSLPPNASQPGARNSVDTNDTRISGTVHYQSGSLYATINTNNGGGGPGILGWRINPTLDDPANSPCTGSFAGYCPVVTSATIDRQFGYDLNGGTVNNAWFGTVIPDPERNITMVFNYSGDSTYPSTAFISMRVTQDPNSPTNYEGWPDSGFFLRAGAAFYNQGRWGDYTAVANDVLDPVTGSGSTTPGLWFTGMYAGSDGLWHTAIGRNGFTSSNQH